MSRIAIQTPDSAPFDARPRLALARQQGGVVPSLLGVLANAPVALESYQAVSAIQARGGLSAAERAVVRSTAAVLDGDTGAYAAQGGLPDDARLRALAAFTQAVITEKGRVSDAALQRFFDAGYHQSHALEVVLGVSLATLGNYASNLAQTPISAP